MCESRPRWGVDGCDELDETRGKGKGKGNGGKGEHEGTGNDRGGGKGKNVEERRTWVTMSDEDMKSQQNEANDGSVEEQATRMKQEKDETGQKERSEEEEDQTMRTLRSEDEEDEQVEVAPHMGAGGSHPRPRSIPKKPKRRRSSSARKDSTASQDNG